MDDGAWRLRFPIAYRAGHDDCLATVPHYHDRPYELGDWSAQQPEIEAAAFRSALLDLADEMPDPWSSRLHRLVGDS